MIRVLEDKTEITRGEPALKTGITPDGIKYHLDKLRKDGKIRHVDPTKKGKQENL